MCVDAGSRFETVTTTCTFLFIRRVPTQPAKITTATAHHHYVFKLALHNNVFQSIFNVMKSISTFSVINTYHHHNNNISKCRPGLTLTCHICFPEVCDCGCECWSAVCGAANFFFLLALWGWGSFWFAIFPVMNYEYMGEKSWILKSWRRWSTPSPPSTTLT